MTIGAWVNVPADETNGAIVFRQGAALFLLSNGDPANWTVTNRPALYAGGRKTFCPSPSKPHNRQDMSAVLFDQEILVTKAFLRFLTINTIFRLPVVKLSVILCVETTFKLMSENSICCDIVCFNSLKVPFPDNIWSIS
jgi:hypothetical protein